MRPGSDSRGSVWLLAGGVAALIVLLALPSFNEGGPEMDEGTLLAYPSFISELGLVPGRDFETFYGPGQPYLLAGLGEAFGLSLALERALGLSFQLVICLGVFALVLPVGRWTAAAAALAAALVLIGLGLQALAILGGLAALIAGLAILVPRFPRPGAPAPSSWWPELVAGLAAAAALTFRPDLAPAALLAGAPLLLWRSPGTPFGPPARGWLLGLVVGLVPLLAWLAVVGPDGLSRLFEDLTASRPGRRLPLPGLTTVEAGLLATTVVVLACSALGAVLRLRRDRYDADGRMLLAVALLLAALLPSMLQRADSAHIFPVAAIAVGLSPVVAFRLLDSGLRGWMKPLLALAGAIVVVGFAHAAEGALRGQATSIDESGSEVANDARSFRVSDPQAAADIRALVPEIRSRARPGDSIFVGPSDLTRTVYGDTFVYYLFDELEPASFYTELNPGTANGDASTLADELAAADMLLLTSRWEPDTNEAAEPGSAEAQRLVDERFCTVATAGSYELLVPCAAER
jgi:hypothetical protein